MIEEEGSFTLDKLNLFGVNWDASDNDDNNEDKDFLFGKKKSGKVVAKTIRVVCEPMLEVVLDLETLKWPIYLRGMHIMRVSI